MQIKDVFTHTIKDGNFAHHMSNFGHIFLDSPATNLVNEEPPTHQSIDKSHYVYAACFVHYWTEVFLIETPKWVFKDKYYNPPPLPSPMHEYIAKLTPDQFKLRNLFIPSTKVIYL